MVAGMTTVFLFLLLMMFTIQVVAYLTRNITAREIAEINRAKQIQGRKKEKDTSVPIAVIAAAISAFERDRSRK